jgi:phosphoribosylaminoimidazolecarboxamide formyltransferase/IMP cyclohydrolase
MNGKKIRTALLAARDKTGIPEFARHLRELDISLLATEGTQKALAEAGIDARTVTDLTGFPPILGGRVKTLHPAVFSGILARRDVPGDLEELEKRKVPPVDLVAVDLYPFEEAATREGLNEGEIVEEIDIGGVSLLRAAAKNHAHVAVLCDRADYGPVLEELQATDGVLGEETRRRLARKAFSRTCLYDAAIAGWLESPDELPEQLAIGGRSLLQLRYGENPHQAAGFYVPPGPLAGLAAAEQLQGKEISYNNLLDADSALAIAAELARGGEGCAVSVVKHGNPCGAALLGEPSTALEAALATDPTSAFGGVMAFSREVDRESAEIITSAFYEVVAAPEVSAEAREILSTKKNLRVLRVALPDPASRDPQIKTVAGGFLLQERDGLDVDEDKLRVLTERQPTDEEWAALRFAWRVVKHVRSNAIVFAASDRTLGIGAGQMTRSDSVKLAAWKAGEQGISLKGSVLASDGFFPFRDGPDAAADAGATAIIQPAGSIRDEEVVAAANEHGLTMVATGVRHFKH